MAGFSKLKTTFAYARLGLVSLAATIAPITGTAQELCGSDLFEGEPDADILMNLTLEFLDILETNGVVAFEGSDGRVSIGAARDALQDGIGSANLLACVVNSDAIEFAGGGAPNQIIGCASGGRPALLQAGSPVTRSSMGQLFCTQEVVTRSQFLGSES